MTQRPDYAEATLEGVWILDPEARLLERQLARGFSGSGDRPTRSLRASTHPDTPSWAALDDRLAPASVLESHQSALVDRIARVPNSVGISARIDLTHLIDGDREALRTSIRLRRRDGATLISNATYLEEDLTALLEEPGRTPASETPAGLPILWRDGTGGVLMHEAVGHPAVHGARPLDWPRWLRVLDDPERDPFESRRGGPAYEPSDLFAAPPPRVRRSSFRDQPLPRMSHVIAASDRAPFALPTSRIEVIRTDGGGWDPLTDRVTVEVSLALLISPAEPARPVTFTFSRSRAEIAHTLVGADTEVVRYPGVICSELGQRLPVGTSSCALLLEAGE